MTTTVTPTRISRGDVALAVAMGLVSVVSGIGLLTAPRAFPVDLAAQIHVHEGSGVGAFVAAGVLLLAQGLCLIWRRVHPVACLVAIAACQIAVAGVLATALSTALHFQAPALAIAAYSAGAWLPNRTALLAVTGIAVTETPVWLVLMGHGIASGAGVWTQVVSSLIAYAGAALIGIFVRTRREQNALLRLQVEQAERERESLAAQAVLSERNRIARELHDVAAHHLSGIVIQATAAERLVGTDPDRAREAMAYVRAQGRETLDNLRLVVGILRAESDGAESTPQPGLAGIDALVEEARAFGPVRHDRVGEASPMAPTAELTVYRVLQESLANARRHAPGVRVTVREEYSEDRYTVTIQNPGGTGSGESASDRRPGYGVVGMRERAAVAGGELDAGTLPGGGWRVRLRVPVAPAPKESP